MTQQIAMKLRDDSEAEDPDALLSCFDSPSLNETLCDSDFNGQGHSQYCQNQISCDLNMKPAVIQEHHATDSSFSKLAHEIDGSNATLYDSESLIDDIYNEDSISSPLSIEALRFASPAELEIAEGDASRFASPAYIEVAEVDGSTHFLSSQHQHFFDVNLHTWSTNTDPTFE